ncbi:MAG: hypothetical protein K2K11_02750 [Bacteroidales bacterium]|nr:hypothetical protein [Bacteroidales bacterium]MDE6630321.1 hypothetical protein [Bacteroidales bacterium]MDE7337700.1 hypothetical protein [Bacteroidales bacterium]
MDALKNLVSDIEQKANQLVSKLNKLELENRQLRSRLDQAETMLDMQKKKTKELENKNSILKVSGSLNRNGDKQERQRAQAVIDGLIKEVDRCLMLLDNEK